MNTTGSKESMEGIVYELSAVVCLDSFDGKAELSVDIIAKICNMCGNFRFASEGKCPTKMSEIIKQNEIILMPGYTGNRGCPYITVNKFKGHGAK
jgi:hypothetical protein